MTQTLRSPSLALCLLCVLGCTPPWTPRLGSVASWVNWGSWQTWDSRTQQQGMCHSPRARQAPSRGILVIGASALELRAPRDPSPRGAARACPTCKPMGGPVCGADALPYPTTCHSLCNYAQPSTPGACSKCQSLCRGFWGQRRRNPKLCPQGINCNFPSWNPNNQFMAFALFPMRKNPLCFYTYKQCSNMAAAAYQKAARGAAARLAKDTMFKNCYSCQRVPCRGPPGAIPANSPVCKIKGACRAARRDRVTRQMVRDVVCAYWNRRGKPL